MAVCDYNGTVGYDSVSVDTYLVFHEKKYARKVLEQHFAEMGFMSFFRPEVESDLGLGISDSINIRFETWQNPFDSVASSDVVYKDGETCPPVLDPDCGGCVDYSPQYENCEVKFDKQYQVGVKECIENRKFFTRDSIESRFRKVLKDNTEVIAIRAWNALVCQLIAANQDALIEDPCVESHYIDAGSNGIYNTMSNITNYAQQVYGSYLDDWIWIVHPFIERKLGSVSSDLPRYDQTGLRTVSGLEDRYAAGGFRKSGVVPMLWGTNVIVAPNTRAIGQTLAGNQNPFISEDGTKMRALLVSPKAFYHGSVAKSDPIRFYPSAADCNAEEGFQQKFFTWNKLLFPEEAILVEFNIDCPA